MPDLKAILTKDDAWEACLALWKRMSEIKLGERVHKGEILKSLGYDSMFFNCPMCEYSRYFKKVKCSECPINQHFNYPAFNIGCMDEKSSYKKWADAAMKGDYHDQPAAEAFYKELRAIAKKDGYLSRRRKQ